MLPRRHQWAGACCSCIEASLFFNFPKIPVEMLSMGKSQYDRDAFLLKGPRLPQLAIESLELQNRKNTDL